NSNKVIYSDSFIEYNLQYRKEVLARRGMMMSNHKELHVVVGTGPLGMAVMQELREQNKAVRMVNRSGRGNLPPGVELVQGDATEEASIEAACSGATVVYHCAKAPYTHWPEQFPPITEGI